MKNARGEKRAAAAAANSMQIRRAEMRQKK